MEKLFNFYWKCLNNLVQDKEYLNHSTLVAYNVCKCFYGFILFFRLNDLYQSNLESFIYRQDIFRPKWPIMFLDKAIMLNQVDFCKLIIFFSVLGIFIGLVYGTKYRFARSIAFFSILVSTALENSFGKGSHSMHLSIWISFFLVFIPSQNELKFENKKNLLRVFFIIRSFILMIYSSSGAIKLFRIIQFSLQEKLTAFGKNGFSNQIAKDWYYSGEATLLGPLIVQNESWLWPLCYLCGLLFELLSITIIFKPHLDKIWALFAGFFHVGILVTLGPNFINHLFVIILFMGYGIYSLDYSKEKDLVV